MGLLGAAGESAGLNALEAFGRGEDVQDAAETGAMFGPAGRAIGEAVGGGIKGAKWLGGKLQGPLSKVAAGIDVPPAMAREGRVKARPVATEEPAREAMDPELAARPLPPKGQRKSKKTEEARMEASVEDIQRMYDEAELARVDKATEAIKGKPKKPAFGANLEGGNLGAKPKGPMAAEEVVEDVGEEAVRDVRGEAVAALNKAIEDTRIVTQGAKHEGFDMELNKRLDRLRRNKKLFNALTDEEKALVTRAHRGDPFTKYVSRPASKLLKPASLLASVATGGGATLLGAHPAVAGATIGSALGIGAAGRWAKNQGSREYAREIQDLLAGKRKPPDPQLQEDIYKMSRMLGR
jgi:hypothetical protein